MKTWFDKHHFNHNPKKGLTVNQIAGSALMATSVIALMNVLYFTYQNALSI